MRKDVVRDVGKCWGRCEKGFWGVRVGGDVGGCGKCWGKCEKVFWDMEKVREEVWGNVGGVVGKCVGVWGR